MKQQNNLYKKQFYKNNHLNFAGTVITLLIFVAIQISIAVVLQIFLDVANGGTLKEFWRAMVIFILVMGAMVVTQFMKRIFMNHFMKRALQQYKNYIFGRILNKNINSFHKESSSTYLSAFSNDLASIEQNYLRGTFNIIMQGALFLGGTVAMAYYNWKIFLCTMLASLLPILVSVLYGNRLTTAETNVSEENSTFLALLKDLLAGFPVIKSFKVDKEIYHNFEDKNGALEQTKKRRWDINDSVEILNTLAGLIVELTVFGLGVYFALQGVITAGVVVAYIQLLNYVLGPITSLGQLIVNRKAAGALIDKIGNLAETSEDPEGSQELTVVEEGIFYENVSFGYEEGLRTIKNVNLKFEKGKSYAIVGGSGSGKSTLLNLLLGYHRNYEGQIKFDNHELREISSSSLYDMVSTIQQNVFVFNNSIADNISLLQKFDKELLDYAIKCAGLSKLIEEKGPDYKCGENGSNLSGGEKQRISIARCLIRKTPFLLMDEATAALDNQTSRQVEEAILSISNLTKIIITHKMEESILRKYDQIIVMNQGMVVEQGSFEELIEAKGYFNSLYAVTKAPSGDFEKVSVAL
jgi:ATP-binding cassette, subfamily B, bacterial